MKLQTLKPIKYHELDACWKKPTPLRVELNNDGSTCNGSIGAGGLLRDEHGNWIRGFSSFLGSGSSMLVDVISLNFGVLWAGVLWLLLH